MIRIKRLSPLLVVLGLLVAARAHATSVYWTDTNYALPKLGKANDDGSNPQLVPLAPGTLPEGLAMDTSYGELYWGEEAWTGANLNHAGADLGGIATLVSGGSSMHGVALDALHHTIYWTSSNLVDGGQIHMADADGSNPVVIVSQGVTANPRGIAVDPAGGRLYWADYDRNVIYQSNLIGGGAWPLVSVGLTTPWGLALNAATSKLYVTEYVPGRIQSYTIPGALLSIVLGGLSNPTYIAVDPSSGRMFWTEAAGAQRVRRANLDGTALTNLNLPLATYGGIAVGPGSALSADEMTPATEFALDAIRPNPTHDLARIVYSLARETSVRLSVLDVQGREVARLVDGIQTPGRHQTTWTGVTGHGRAPAGLYFVRYMTPERVITRRLALTR